MAPDKKHYSYTVYAKSETAETFEAKRFGGPIGSYMRERQDRQLESRLGDPTGTFILDIGAGTGRTAIPLAALGADVVAADASEAMLKVARKNAADAGVKMDFDICDAMNLPYDDGAFDTVLCLRVLMHVLDWKKALAEACRCSGKRLIFDFPPRWALAALQVPARAVVSVVRPSIQRFRLMSLRQVRAELRRNGFAVEKVDRLWVLPIAFHKLFKSIAFTRAVEKVLGAVGLRRLFGAPVTVFARRAEEPASPDYS